MRRGNSPSIMAAALLALLVRPCAAQSGSSPPTREREVLAGVMVWRSETYSTAVTPDSLFVQAAIGINGVRWFHNRFGVSGAVGFVGGDEVFFWGGARTRIYVSGRNSLSFGFNYALGGAWVPEVLFGRRLSRNYSVKVGVAGIVGCGLEGACPVIFPTFRLAL